MTAIRLNITAVMKVKLFSDYLKNLNANICDLEDAWYKHMLSIIFCISIIFDIISSV
jgi:hypothetical protein